MPETRGLLQYPKHVHQNQQDTLYMGSQSSQPYLLDD